MTAAYFMPTPSARWLFLLELLLFFCFTMATWLASLKASVYDCLFVGISGYTVQHLAQQVKNLLLLWLYPYVESAMARVDFERILTAVSLVAVGAAVYFLLARRLRRGAPDTDKKRYLILSALVLMFSVALSGLTTPATDTDYIVQKLYAAVCCVLALFLTYGLVTEKKLENELATVNRIRSEEKEHYLISKETIELINLKCHDLKHQISRLGRGGSVDPDELKKIEGAVNIYDSVLKTGNEALDVILTEKSLSCEKNGITLSCIIDGAALSFMKDSDIYSLFGNALDNAMEAVRALEQPDRRIGLQVQRRRDLVLVHMQNKYSGKLSFDDGLPVTTKADRNYHGFGMRSMKLIVEEYGGAMTIGSADGIFAVDMLFPVKKGKADAETRPA